MKSPLRIPIARSLIKVLAGLSISLMLLGSSLIAAPGPLTVAVSLDIPPYVMDHAKRGVEVDILRQALPDYKLKWVQMDYAELESAVSDQKADIAMSVQTRKPNVFYSVDYIGFANFAISKKADHLKLKDVADLKGHPVLTWDNAWTELGETFRHQYAPGSPERTNYIEVANQAGQVRRFWEGKDKVIVIDRSIFDYFSEQQGHSLDEVEYHDLFPKITKFKVAFADAAIRNEFNARLKQLCEGGEYRRILKRYHMSDLANVCGEPGSGKLSKPHPKL